MNNRVTLTKTSGNCTIQDLGRIQAQHIGFSVSGAADEFSFKSANKLLSNEMNTPALEVTLGQLTLIAHCDCTFIVTGADCNAKINDKSIDHWKVSRLNNGDTLTLLMPHKGLISYVAFYGGISSKVFYNSASQTKNEKNLGVFEPILATDYTICLTEGCLNNSLASHSLSVDYKRWLNFDDDLILRFIPNKTWEQLQHQSKEKVISQEYQIESNSNRMGYRLSGANAITEKLEQGLSKPVTFGTIQLPPNGQPIILMKERQTIGGYPTIGTVIQVDLFRLSQKRAGQKVKLFPTSIEQAQAQLMAFNQRFT